MRRSLSPRRAAVVLVVGILAALSLLSVTSPSAGAESNPFQHCNAGLACAWKDSGFVTGGNADKKLSALNRLDDLRQWDFGVNGNAVPCPLCTGNANDEITSLANNGTGYDPAYYHHDIWCQGTYVYVQNQYQWNIPGSNGWNDQISSYAFNSSHTSCKNGN